MINHDWKNRKLNFKFSPPYCKYPEENLQRPRPLHSKTSPDSEESLLQHFCLKGPLQVLYNGVTVSFSYRLIIHFYRSRNPPSACCKGPL